MLKLATCITSVRMIDFTAIIHVKTCIVIHTYLVTFESNSTESNQLQLIFKQITLAPFVTGEFCAIFTF